MLQLVDLGTSCKYKRVFSCEVKFGATALPSPFILPGALFFDPRYLRKNERMLGGRNAAVRLDGGKETRQDVALKLVAEEQALRQAGTEERQRSKKGVN